MANWTSTQLATDVLKQLGIVGAGQSAAAEDLVIVTDAWASIYPQLRRHGLAPWGSEAIEEEAQLPLAKYVAGEVASKFGLGMDPSIRADAQSGWKQLQEQSSMDRSPLAVRNEYF